MIAIGSRVQTDKGLVGTVVAVVKGDSLTASSYTVKIGRRLYHVYGRKLTDLGEIREI